MPLVIAVTIEPPQRGFDQNIGQYPSDILFALDDRIFYKNKIQIHDGFSVQFADSDPSVAVTGKDPMAFPLNLYLGGDPKLWRENVPHFSTVRYGDRKSVV